VFGGGGGNAHAISLPVHVAAILEGLRQTPPHQ